MANVAKINGYDVKDAEARGDIADIQQDLSTAQGDITTLQGDVLNTEADLGDITALTTTVKTSAVNAINEVNGKTEDNADNIGTLANLTTTANTDLVSAINEVDSHADTNTTNIGNLASLNTVDKSDIVSAVNEVERNASYGISKNTYNFAPTFSDETSYAVGDYVTYNGVLYKCTTAHTAGAWVAGHFTRATIGGELNNVVPSDASPTNKLLAKSDLRIQSKTSSEIGEVLTFAAGGTCMVYTAGQGSNFGNCLYFIIPSYNGNPIIVDEGHNNITVTATSDRQGGVNISVSTVEAPITVYVKTF